MVILHEDLLDILACPQCKGRVRMSETKDGLICDQCRLLYAIENGIPIMLIDEAIKMAPMGPPSE